MDHNRAFGDAEGLLQREAFRLAFSASRTAMTVADARLDDNPIVFANDAFLELTGYGLEEVIGRNCRFLQGHETDPDTVAAVREAIEAGKPVTAELLNRRKNGEPFWIRLTVSPVRDPDGRLCYFHATQQDVSDGRRVNSGLKESVARLQREVEQHTAELRRALAAKDALLHEVDHRVKNNLQLITSLISMQARCLSDAELRPVLNRTLERVGALSLLHGALYAAHDVERFDLSALIERMADNLAAAKERSGLTIEVDAEPVQAQARQGAPVALLLSEVLSNAVHHGAPEAGRASIRVGVRRAGGDALITIEDNGPGFAGELDPRKLGSKLIRQLSIQLKAEIDWQPLYPGTKVEIRLPVPGLGDEPSATTGKPPPREHLVG